EGKPVLGVEYEWTEQNKAEVCGVVNGLGFDWLLKKLELDSTVQFCRTYPVKTAARITSPAAAATQLPAKAGQR
ncbi:hypothetical protein HK104_002882, partial [Borealophlyctis nickersoniae]